MYEFELAHELEAIPEISEGEWETAQSEAETEAFFGRLARLARRAIQSPALRRIGLAAARSALGGLGPAGKAAAGLLPQQEAEFEAEWESLPELEMEYEAETELNPVRRIYPDALLEHLGHVAAEAESEAEVAAIARRMVPLVTRAMPGVARIIRRNAPQLARGLANVARTLGRSPNHPAVVACFAYHPAAHGGQPEPPGSQSRRAQPKEGDGLRRSPGRASHPSLGGPTPAGAGKQWRRLPPDGNLSSGEPGSRSASGAGWTGFYRRGSCQGDQPAGSRAHASPPDTNGSWAARYRGAHLQTFAGA